MGMTVKDEGKPFRLVIMRVPYGVSLLRAWYSFSELKYSCMGLDHCDSSAGTLMTVASTASVGLPVYVVIKKVGCVREHAHCSTRYIS